MEHGFLVGLFDVLGFEERLRAIGLKKMRAHYGELIEAVDQLKLHARRLFGEMQFEESPYWIDDGDVFIFSETKGAYASDSILLWSNRTWPEVRTLARSKCMSLARNPSSGWCAQPIPCDNFLDACNELICHGLEVALPLRGAVAMGKAMLEERRSVYLGLPLVDAARLERGQRFIGAGICKSFLDQVIPKRFTLQFEQHLKAKVPEQWGGCVLDWPRHWRRTRTKDLFEAIGALDKDSKQSDIYRNTLALAEYSARFANQFESPQDVSIRSLYKEFSWQNESLSVRARAVRRVSAEPKAQ